MRLARGRLRRQLIVAHKLANGQVEREREMAIHQVRCEAKGCNGNATAPLLHNGAMLNPLSVELLVETVSASVE